MRQFSNEYVMTKWSRSSIFSSNHYFFVASRFNYNRDNFSVIISHGDIVLCKFMNALRILCHTALWVYYMEYG